MKDLMSGGPVFLPRYLGIPGIINFGGGLPHPTSFPISSLSFNLPILSQTLQIPNSYVPPPNEPYTLSEVPSATLDLGRMLQYGGSSGPEELRNVLKDMVVSQGGVAHANWDLILSCGNTDGLDAFVVSYPDLCCSRLLPFDDV